MQYYSLLAVIRKFLAKQWEKSAWSVRPVQFWEPAKLLWGKRSKKVKVEWSRYKSGVAQSVGRGIALLFQDRGTRRGWVVSSTPRPHFTSRKTQYPFYRRLGGVYGRSGRAENLVPTGIRSRTVRPLAQSLYRLNYPVHEVREVDNNNNNNNVLLHAMNVRRGVQIRIHSFLTPALNVWLASRSDHFTS